MLLFVLKWAGYDRQIKTTGANSVLLKFWGFTGLASLLPLVQFPTVDSHGFGTPQISKALSVSGNFMKEHTVKDNILCYLRTIGNGDFYKECLASECAEKLNIEYDIAFSAIDNLIIDKLIDFRDAASKGTLRYEKLIRINHHGLFFLRQGGFTSAKRTDNQRRRLNVAKEAMTYISTFAIIIISYLNYIATDKANENKEIIANYDLTIKKLTSKVDSLQTLVKRDTTKKHKNSH